MAQGVNKVILIGHLGNDPELKYTPNGSAVASFRMATNERWQDKDGKATDHTEWHHIVAWKKLAEIIGEYLKKGSQVYIEGKLRTRNWEDQNGVKRYQTEIIASSMMMLGRKGETTPSETGAEEFTNTDFPPQEGDEKQANDLPF